MFADVALNINPTAEQLADIAVESCKTFRDIVPENVLPEVNGAMISYSTKGSGQGPTVSVIREAEPLAQEKLRLLQERDARYQSITINGELKVSVAISLEAAEVKLKDRLAEFHGAGQANVLIVPLLDQGNMLYHLFSTQYPDATSSLVMGGMDGQVLDYSRGSSVGQVILGAKLLFLTRMKSDRALSEESPLSPTCKVLAISSKQQAALFAGEQCLGKTDTLDQQGLIALFEAANIAPETLNIITTDALAKDGKEHLSQGSAQDGIPAALGKAFGVPVLVHELPAPAPTHLSMQHLVAHTASLRNKSPQELKLLIAELEADELCIGAWKHGRWLAFQRLPIKTDMPSVDSIDKQPDNAVIFELLRQGYQVPGTSASEQQLEHMVTGIASQIATRLPEFAPERVDTLLLSGKLCNNPLVSGTLEEIFRPLCTKTLIFPGNHALEALNRDGRIFCQTGTLF